MDRCATPAGEILSELTVQKLINGWAAEAEGAAAASGGAVVGGCCGIFPRHIAAIREAIT